MKIFNIFYYGFIAIVILIASLLAFSALPITGNYKVMTVLSGSMEPAIKTGSVVIIKPSDDYRIGDIITFGKATRTQPPTTHRIYDMKVIEGNPIYLTKGDANNAPDNKDVLKRDIIGKVLFSIPYVGYGVDAAQKPIGFVLIIVVPAAFIMYDEIKKIWSEIKKMKNKKKDKEQDKEIQENKEKDQNQDEEIQENKDEIDQLKEDIENLKNNTNK